MTTSSSASTRSTASQLAIEQANADGGLGFKLKLLKADDGGDQAKAPAAAAAGAAGRHRHGRRRPVVLRRLAGRRQELRRRQPRDLISPSASNGDLQDQGFTTWHRVMPNDYVEGPGCRLAGQEGQEGLRHRRPQRVRQGCRRRRGPRAAEEERHRRSSRRLPTDHDQGLRPDRPEVVPVRCRRPCSTAATTPRPRRSPRR